MKGSQAPNLRERGFECLALLIQLQVSKAEPLIPSSSLSHLFRIPQYQFLANEFLFRLPNLKWFQG